MEEMGRDVPTVLRLGVQGLKLNFFPDCRIMNKSRHKRLVWNSNYLLKIIEEEAEVLQEDYVCLTLEIVNYMEEYDLVHSSKFNAFKDEQGCFVFPWIPEIALRLEDSNLNRPFLIQIATYVSCLGLLQNYWFVNFRKLHTLHVSIQTHCKRFQELLKRRKILSEHTLSSIVTFKAYRLHESVPIVFPEPVNFQNEEETPSDENHTPEITGESCDQFADVPIDSSSERELVHYTERRGRHAGFSGRWSPQEMECLHDVIQRNMNSVQEAYELYQKQCIERKIPDRTFAAFKAKYFRVKS